MIETTVSQRRELDSERMTKETEDQKRAREVGERMFYTNSFVHESLGSRCTKGGCPIRNLKRSTSILLRALRQAIQECRPI